MNARERAAALVATCLDDGSFVNLGIGLPGLVPTFVDPSRGVLFHAEHGVIGFGPVTPSSDDRRMRFFGGTYALGAGAAILDHAESFSLVRAGRLDATVLGAFEVAVDGSFANWRSPTMAFGGVGGSPELSGGAKRVIIALEHRTRTGRPRLVERTTLDVGLPRKVDLVVTELGCFRPAGDHFAVERLAPGVEPDQVVAVTGADVVFEP